MQYFYTLLVIGYEVAENPTHVIVVFDDYESCQQSLVIADPLYNYIDAYEMYCIESDVTSQIIMPKPRPKAQSEEHQ